MINGVQKIASAVISPTKRKIGGAVFVWLFL
ncbi:hydrolase [Enterococcus faecium]|nr:hydrolase [Enterococcus faecium]EGP5530044.1 hydrolase [Enterococcus faecium]EGP5708554.1 hydrolase [Enterococcus faecium]PQC11662.1 hydrolase [Enterococcus faecium]PQC47400.1 hydrolase [Enterococcus faecium]